MKAASVSAVEVADVVKVKSKNAAGTRRDADRRGIAANESVRDQGAVEPLASARKRAAGARKGARFGSVPPEAKEVAGARFGVKAGLPEDRLDGAGVASLALTAAEAEAWVSTARSEVMSGRSSRDTRPEKLLRSALHRAGVRFRTHRRVPGELLTIDIVLPKHRVALYVDGCFWHGRCERHPRREPTGPNADRWRHKFASIAERERRAARRLSEAGWLVIRVHACEVLDAPDIVAKDIINRLKEGSRA
jgi:DNA mismatch endonuclease (patch repair protein)